MIMSLNFILGSIYECDLKVEYEFQLSLNLSSIMSLSMSVRLIMSLRLSLNMSINLDLHQQCFRHPKTRKGRFQNGNAPESGQSGRCYNKRYQEAKKG